MKACKNNDRTLFIRLKKKFICLKLLKYTVQHLNYKNNLLNWGIWCQKELKTAQYVLCPKCLRAFKKHNTASGWSVNGQAPIILTLNQNSYVVLNQITKEVWRVCVVQHLLGVIEETACEKLISDSLSFTWKIAKTQPGLGKRGPCQEQRCLKGTKST